MQAKWNEFAAVRYADDIKVLTISQLLVCTVKILIIKAPAKARAAKMQCDGWLLFAKEADTMYGKTHFRMLRCNVVVRIVDS